MASPWIHDLFDTIDRMDAAAFASFITEDGVFAFGNNPPAVGREAITAAVGGFYQAIAGLSHTLTEVWETPTAVLVEGRVTYTRHDGSTLTLPFFDVFRMRGGAVREYLIYMDINPLFAAQG